MKKTLLVLSLLGTSAAVMAQDTQTQGMDDGRIAAQDMVGMVTTPALPIMQTYVPDDILNNVKSTYGERLYSIKSVKSGNGEDVYQVTLIDNQQSTVAWVGSTGSEVAYVYRTNENEAMNASTNNTNTGNMNTATETSPATAEPATDDMSAPTNTLDQTPSDPQMNNTINDNSANQIDSTNLNTQDATIDDTASPETSTNASDANKPEDEEL